jgi:hypothetical protein
MIVKSLLLNMSELCSDKPTPLLVDIEIPLNAAIPTAQTAH